MAGFVCGGVGTLTVLLTCEDVDCREPRFACSRSTFQVVPHEVACVEWCVDWRSAVTLMT